MDGNNGQPTQPAGVRPRWWRRRWFKVVVSLAAAGCLVLVIAAEYIIHNAEPIIRKRVIETLSARFDAPVELDHLSISLVKGIEVEGWGLRIPFGAGVVTRSPPVPMIGVRYFAFRTTVKGLLRQPTHVAAVRVDGMELHIPPPSERGEIFGTKEGRKPADPNNPRTRPKIALIVNELQCRDVKLFIESGKPGKEPLEFDIASLDMHDVGRNQAMVYDAQLTNPKPVGAIHAVGHFGPWAGTPSASADSDPGQTPLDGNYSFDHADLNTIKGIGGILSSTGHFSGVLDKMFVDGETDVPNFSLDISNRPVPLHTRFHALVDGTSGDTYLQPVQARLENSGFTVSGKIVKIKGEGHDILLDVDVPHGRMEDFLRLAVKTNPPVMDGILDMKAKLHLPPGDVRVPEKLQMQGDFHLAEVRFNNRKLQDRIDGLSVRAQGNPKDVKQVSEDRRAEVRSRLSARFAIGHGIMTVTDVRYEIPGATVLLNGVYSMDGRLFEFKGHVRTEATASQMVTGWKHWLLKPVDPFLKKDGAGLQLPIEITGTEGDVHFGLAMHGTDETPKEMLSDIRDRERAKRALAEARREADQADAEDREAAHASTLQEAQRAHKAAVRHRAEAQAKAAAAENSARTPQP